MVRGRAAIITLVPALLVAASAPCLPSRFGLTGFSHTIDARSAASETFLAFLSASYQFASVEDYVHLAPQGYPHVDTVLLVEDWEHYADGSMAFGIGLPENVEAAMSVSFKANGYQFDQVDPRGNFVGYLEAQVGIDDVTFAAKYGRQVHPQITAGGALWVSAPLGNTDPDLATDHDGYWDRNDRMLQMRRPFLCDGKTAFGFLALASGSYSMVDGHLNVGYASMGQSYEDSVLGIVDERLSAVDLAVGAEAKSQKASFFLEYWTRMFSGRSGEGYGSPATLTMGLRIFERTGTFFEITGISGMSDFDRHRADPYETGELPVPGGLPGEWGVGFTVGYDAGLLGGAGGAPGVLSGIVVRAETGEPVQATVSIPDEEEVPSTRCNPETGFYTLRVPCGTVLAVAEAEGFYPQTRTVVVPSSGQAALDFDLIAQPPPGGTVAGTVTDRETGGPVASATVTVEGSDVTAVTDQNGRFNLDLPAGTWTLQVSTEDFTGSPQVVSVETGRTSTVSIDLTPSLQEGDVLRFANIYFQSGSAEIQSSSYSVLDEIADLLKANSQARVEIGGHTDSDGSSSYNQGLSERRASSVRQYLVRKGVSSSMLSVRGYGESSPVASNDTPDGKARNRRIEFTVLSAP